MELIDRFEDIEFVDALEERYLAYALTTIMDRALPDVRDGLKPVHRRLLYSMHKLNLNPNSSFKKSARIVGDVMGRFHPHGDQAIYDALVRLAQDFSVRWPLVNGQGNFGNIDGDNAAAMRYTESKLTEVSQLLLEGIEEEAVNFHPTYDEVDLEPLVLPANFPNLLANGSSGIAVGMATSIPPHNVEELCNAALHLIRHRSSRFEKLLKFIPAPDFPTGGEIIENEETRLNIYKTGKGSLRIRAKWSLEKEKKGLWKIVVHEIPYQVNKGKLIEKIAQLIIDKKIHILEDIRDESSETLRIVLIPRSREVIPEHLMEALFEFSDLETRFSVNLNAINNQVPRVHNLRELLLSWIDHRREVLIKRTQYRKKTIIQRLEILKGYLIVYANLDKIIKIIRNEDEPKLKLIKIFKMTEYQAQSILNMQLKSLRKLEEIKIKEEFNALNNEKNILNKLLKSVEQQWRLISEEIKVLKKIYSKKTALGKRRTEISDIDVIKDFKLNFDIPDEKITVVLSKYGWIKSIKDKKSDLSEIKFKDDDELFISHPAISNDKLLFFASNGKFYTLAVSLLSSGRGYGSPLKLMFDLEDGEEILSVHTYEENKKIIMASKFGNGFIVKHDDLISNRKSGKQILNLGDNDKSIKSIDVEGKEIAIIGENRKMLIIPISDLPEMSKGKGVRLQRYKEGYLKDIVSLNSQDGLLIKDSSGRNRHFENVRDWIGKRGQAGKIVPKGFPKQ